MFKENTNQVHCILWLLLYKTIKKNKLIVNSRENKFKKIGINYTLQWTNAMLKILNVVINVSLKHFFKLLFIYLFFYNFTFVETLKH